MVSYKPGRQGSAHLVLPMTLTLCGLIALLGAVYQHTFAPAILQAVGFLLLGGAVFVINRYAVPTFIYTLDEETPGLLCIHRLTGKKKTTPITADMRLAESVRVLTDGSHAKPDGAKRVNMCLNIFPQKRMAILFRDGETLTELVIETDDSFFEEVKKRTKTE